MKGFADVFMLELRMRRAVFPAALVAGLIPIPLALMMKGVASFPDALNVGAYAFALIGGELLALYLGATVLCQDLSEGRQGFYFARPLSGFALWAGKFTAAWAVVLGAMFVVLIPATFMGEGLANLGAADNPLWVYDLGPQTLSPLWSLLFQALAVLFFMGLAHAVSLMFRSRSTWLALDAVMVVVIPTLAWWGLRRLTGFWEMYGLLTILLLVYAAGALLAVLPAGALQTVFGRCDLKRGHKILSLTLWAMATVFVLGCSAFAYHVTHLTPANLAAIEYASPAPAGDWAVIGGPARGMARYVWPTFIANTRNGSWVLPPESRWGGGPFLAPDGKMALCFDMRAGGYHGPYDLVSYDLTSPATPEPKSHGVVVQSANTHIWFSPDSTRIALLAGQDLSVLDVSTWKVLAVQRLPFHEGRWERYMVAFIERDRLLIFRCPTGPRDEKGLTLMEFDVAGKKLQQVGQLPRTYYPKRLDASGGKMLATEGFSPWDLLLCDARTGTVLKTLLRQTAHGTGYFLWDGRILAIDRTSTDTVLHLFTPEGEELKTFSLGAPRRVRVGAEPAPNQVMLETWEVGSGMLKTGDVRRLDLAAGTVQVLPGIKPCRSFWTFYQDAWWHPASSRPAWDLYLDDKGKLVRHDFATGETEEVKIGN